MKSRVRDRWPGTPALRTAALCILVAALLLGLVGCRRGSAGAARLPGDSAPGDGGCASADAGESRARWTFAQRPMADAALLERDVRYLADDRREGRGLGSSGLEDALRFVARRFRELGLTPVLREHPRPGDDLDLYLQPFTSQGFPPSANVIGILPAQPRSATASGQSAEPPAQPRSAPPPPASTMQPPAVVIVAAHVDHLGCDPQLSGDQIYNGADDNASGVAAMLEIARLLATQPNRERAVVFVAFSGEESGMLGSRHYVAHPIVPLSETLAMINLDSVGKLRGDQLIVFGMDSAREFAAILEGVNPSAGLRITKGSRGVEGSDHRSFVAAGIPALHFFTGAHSDFSKVSDEADGIDYAGLARVTNYVAETVRYLTYRDRPLTFVAAQSSPGMAASAGATHPEAGGGPATAAGGGTPQRRVSLGFMPDFAGEVAGVRVAGVNPGGAAEAAGLAPGDIIVGIDGETVTSLQDYTAILRQHAPGDEIRVRLLRAGITQTVTATLQERQ